MNTNSKEVVVKKPTIDYVAIEIKGLSPLLCARMPETTAKTAQKNKDKEVSFRDALYPYIPNEDGTFDRYGFPANGITKVLLVLLGLLPGK